MALIKGQQLPPYDPDGDGDNDAEEAAGLIGAACILMEQAMSCLTSTAPDTDEAMAARRRAATSNVVSFPKQKSVLQVRSQGNAAEIDFFGVVGGDYLSDGGVTKEQFAAELKQLPAGTTNVTMRMSSPGGDVFDGRAIANMIRQHPARFDMNIIAEASSAASIIAMSGDTIHMAEGAMMLIHRCWTIALGNAVDMRKLADDLDLIDQEAVATYAKRTGMKSADVISLMDENRYMNAAECKQLGFCDTIDAGKPAQLAGLRIAAMDIDRSKFRLPPLPENMRPRRVAAIAALARMKAARAA